MSQPNSPVEDAPYLYEKRKAVYPKAVDGTFRRLKWAIMLVTLAIYYITPWLRWDRGPYAPDQAVLVDMAHRRFYMFSIEIWPHEFYYVAGLLVMAGIGLFLVTSAVGRAWCGYACPQTVWTDLFQHVERWIDGDRNAQLRRPHASILQGQPRQRREAGQGLHVHHSAEPETPGYPIAPCMVPAPKIQLGELRHGGNERGCIPARHRVLKEFGDPEGRGFPQDSPESLVGNTKACPEPGRRPQLQKDRRWDQQQGGRVGVLRGCAGAGNFHAAHRQEDRACAAGLESARQTEAFLRDDSPAATKSRCLAEELNGVCNSGAVRTAA